MSKKRRDGRIMAIQFLYQNDLCPTQDIDRSLSEFWEMTDKAVPMRDFARELVLGVLDKVVQLDEIISKYARNWDIKRMAPVDRNILRLCLYEMHYREDIPPVAAINEAVDIAKLLSTEESSKFVNGILDHAKQDIKRSLR